MTDLNAMPSSESRVLWASSVIKTFNYNELARNPIEQTFAQNCPKKKFLFCFVTPFSFVVLFHTPTDLIPKTACC